MSKDVSTNIIEYYSNRAEEYELIYNRNEAVRQKELEEIHKQVRQLFQYKNVLEIACGTGYWTQSIAEVAGSIVAIDISDEMLNICKQKLIPYHNVKIQKMDAYELNTLEGFYDAGCANFWFSHIPKSRIDLFLKSFNNKLNKGSIVFMADNAFIEGICDNKVLDENVDGELITRPGEADTYRIRELLNGDKYEILKNYYSENQLRDIISKHSDNFLIKMGQCYWWLWYITR